jgi:peptide/nickel transport system substrate-binding protein
MRAKKVLVLLTLAVFLVMASGCGKGSSAPSQKETKPLTVGWAQWCTNLDPGDGYNGWYTMEFGMGETLVRVGE